MTGANGGAGADIHPRWRWNVALSFAGAQRDYVEQVAQALKAQRVRCFYDADEEIGLWGKYLAEELQAIYGEQAAVVVVFVSAEYAARDWTRLERRAALARAVRERREYVLPARFDDTPLPGLPPDMSYVDLRGRAPQQFAAMIVGKLATLGIVAPAARTDAGGHVSDVETSRPARAVRVGDADPRRLGVHSAISVPRVPDEVLPEYVSRDVDATEFGVRARVAAAAKRGGFVLLVGGSSVGKTRSAFEAVKALLPDWWLMHPVGPGEVAVVAATPTPRTVVWLDELQRYLDGEHGLTGGVVRALLEAEHPVVIVGTLWPDRYTAYTTMPAPGGADPHAREREVLDLAAVVRIGMAFTAAEQARVRDAAVRDPRLQVALESAGYGLTQTLAAAPQLVARWEDAQTASPYGWAVLTAALDAARLGARAPLSTGFLHNAAPGYCSSQQQAEAPGNWFEQALAYATGKLHGTVAALYPVGAGMGEIAGYTVADYLIQHAGRARRHAGVPASTWDAALSHLRDPADTARFADSARNRLLYCYAIPLYRHAADAGDQHAAWQLADLLADRGDIDELRARADTGDREAASRLVKLQQERGEDLDLNTAVWQLGSQVLRARHPTREERVQEGAETWRLIQRHDIDELRARADAGDWHASQGLAELLARRRDLNELRARVDTGDKYAAMQLAQLLADRGDIDELRARADAGDEYAAMQLAYLLADRGDIDGLRAWADTGDGEAASQLAYLLADRGDIDGAEEVLRIRADAGDGEAALQLADLLTDRGDLDGAEEVLRIRADVGDWTAALVLAMRLARRGDLDGLRARADAGDEHAGKELPGLLIKQGRGEEAERLRRFGLNPDGSIAWG
ncbi:MAG TPA: TIR domain-containing protein [Trebonia sp.]